VRKEIIRGCHDVPLLTRWILAEGRWGKVMFHRFHRSDEDREHHDHPWNFWTVILWRGYVEETLSGQRRLWPGTVRWRSGIWRHRVLLVKDRQGRERESWSLVFAGPRVRDWGFWTDRGWVFWKTFIDSDRCGS